MNSLSNSLSPYLRAHSSNPVNWYEFCQEAFEIANSNDIPVFISIGYQSCHWCHVMAHESFEDEDTAKYLNENFVSIKIDREERPDLDSIYMDAVTLITGSGGWPMSVFCLPDKRPFVGGTYYPRVPKTGMPSFMQVLEQIVFLWNNQREKIYEIAEEITQRISNRSVFDSKTKKNRLDLINIGYLNKQSLERTTAVVEAIKKSWDLVNGGFGAAPKFPNPLNIMLAFRSTFLNQNNDVRDFAIKSLNAMASGGLYDHLLGGFCRYCVDADWTIPHFEKMLYDQSGMINLYIDGYRVTQNEAYLDIVRQTIGWIENFMTDPTGGVYSSVDADSEGQEGRSMIFTYDQICGALLDANVLDAATSWWMITRKGNFDGSNVIRKQPFKLPFPEEPYISQAKSILRQLRLARPQPDIDTKAVLEFNAMLADALLEASFVLNDQTTKDKAIRNLEFLLQSYTDDDGHFHRAIIDGQLFNAYATSSDLGWLILATLKAYEITGNSNYISTVKKLTDYMLEHYVDPSTYEVYMTTDLDKSVIFRPQNHFDNVICSDTSTVANALARLYAITKEESYFETASKIVEPFYETVTKCPLAFANLIHVIDFLENPFQITIHGDLETFADVFSKRFIPNRIFIYDTVPTNPKIEICVNGMCYLPTSDKEQLNILLDKLTKID